MKDTIAFENFVVSIALICLTSCAPARAPLIREPLLANRASIVYRDLLKDLSPPKTAIPAGHGV